MFSIINLFIASLVYYSAYGLPDTQIVGGTDAPEGKYPYQVSLKTTSSGSHFCGGAIVSKRYIITAAHCLEGLYSPNEIVVDVGSNLLYSSKRITYFADALIPHPDYNKTIYANDIGLIKLSKEITFEKNINAIKLISSNPNFENVKLTVTGWGRLWFNGPIPDHLQQINVTVFSQSECSKVYKNIITDNHICTLETINQGMCNGDSGGALTNQKDLVGIVSFGRIPCASGNPDVFTRVYNYKSWVDKYINGGNIQQLNILFGLFTMYLCSFF